MKQTLSKAEQIRDKLLYDICLSFIMAGYWKHIKLSRRKMVLSIRQLIQALMLQNYMQLSNFYFKFTVIMKNLVTQEYKHSL